MAKEKPTQVIVLSHAGGVTNSLKKQDQMNIKKLFRMTKALIFFQQKIYAL